MKRKTSLWLFVVTLLLASLACNLPYQPKATNADQNIMPIEGFRVETFNLEDEQVTIAIPESYQVGDINSGLNSLLENVDLSGVPPSINVQDVLNIAQDNVLLWGYDTESSSGIPPSFAVIKNDSFAMLPLGLVPAVAGPLLGDNITILEEQRLDLGGRDTLRMITKTNATGLDLKQVEYIFKMSGSLYVVIFNAQPGDVQEQILVFDTIVGSLTAQDLN